MKNRDGVKIEEGQLWSDGAASLNAKLRVVAFDDGKVVCNIDGYPDYVAKSPSCSCFGKLIMPYKRPEMHYKCDGYGKWCVDGSREWDTNELVMKACIQGPDGEVYDLMKARWNYESEERLWLGHWNDGLED